MNSHLEHRRNRKSQQSRQRKDSGLNVVAYLSGVQNIFFKVSRHLEIASLSRRKPGHQWSHLSLIWKESLTRWVALFSCTNIRQVGTQCQREFCNKAFYLWLWETSLPSYLKWISWVDVGIFAQRLKTLRSELSFGYSTALCSFQWLEMVQLNSTGKKDTEGCLKEYTPWKNLWTDYPGSVLALRRCKGRVISVKCAACDSAGGNASRIAGTTYVEQHWPRITLGR